jgi:hypothetical protein
MATYLYSSSPSFRRSQRPTLMATYPYSLSPFRRSQLATTVSDIVPVPWLRKKKQGTRFSCHFIGTSNNAHGTHRKMKNKGDGHLYIFCWMLAAGFSFLMSKLKWTEEKKIFWMRTVGNEKTTAYTVLARSMVRELLPAMSCYVAAAVATRWPEGVHSTTTAMVRTGSSTLVTSCCWWCV